MYLNIIILPLLGSIISGFFGRKIGVTDSQLITYLLVIIYDIRFVVLNFRIELKRIHKSRVLNIILPFYINCIIQCIAFNDYFHYYLFLLLNISIFFIFILHYNCWIKDKYPRLFDMIYLSILLAILGIGGYFLLVGVFNIIGFISSRLYILYESIKPKSKSNDNGSNNNNSKKPNDDLNDIIRKIKEEQEKYKSRKRRNSKRYYEKHKFRINADKKNSDYYEKNKEEIKRKSRERYHKNKNKNNV